MRKRSYYDTKKTAGLYSAEQLAAIAAKPAYSIREFCALHGISVATFFNYQRAGIAPPVTRKLPHGRGWITAEAAAAWRRFD
jgi:hypothetical protein